MAEVHFSCKVSTNFISLLFLSINQIYYTQIKRFLAIKSDWQKSQEIGRKPQMNLMKSVMYELLNFAAKQIFRNELNFLEQLTFHV
jgi:hypothetical protein